jgi:hypothetical protein
MDSGLRRQPRILRLFNKVRSISALNIDPRTAEATVGPSRGGQQSEKTISPADPRVRGVGASQELVEILVGELPAMVEVH